MSTSPSPDPARAAEAVAASRTTPWTQRTSRPLRRFLATETGGAVLLLGATVLALVWANSPFGDAYEDLWATPLVVELGGLRVEEDLQHWVNDGLMVLFFYVVGLEIRREIALGELRDRRKAAIPAIGALAGMVVPAGIYLAINAGGPGANGWGVVMATDIAFVLGLLALVARGMPSGVRVFLLTLAIVDDIGAIAVIAVFYSSDISLLALAVGAGILVAIVALQRLWTWRGPAYAVAGVALWAALFASGVHPTIAGVLLGLVTAVHPTRRTDVARAANLTRAFRREPSPQRGRRATLEIARSVSANERITGALHPLTSYLVVPLFALANAGVVLDGETLGAAATSPVTLGIVAGLVVGKTIGISAITLLAVRMGVGPLPQGVTRMPLLAASALAGIGFTVSLFIVDLAFEDPEIAAEAKIGVLAASVLAALIGWVAFRLAARAVAARPAQEAGVGTPPPLDRRAEFVRGPADAEHLVVLYGDYACGSTKAADAAVATLLEERDDVAYLFRNLPIEEEHPGAEIAAEAVEAAGVQGRFWAMHDRLLAHQDDLEPGDLVRHAEAVGLDVEAFAEDLAARVHAPAVQLDVDGARDAEVPGTPTAFVDGRHVPDLDGGALERALADR